MLVKDVSICVLYFYPAFVYLGTLSIMVDFHLRSLFYYNVICLYFSLFSLMLMFLHFSWSTNCILVSVIISIGCYIFFCNCFSLYHCFPFPNLSFGLSHPISWVECLTPFFSSLLNVLTVQLDIPLFLSYDLS